MKLMISNLLQIIHRQIFLLKNCIELKNEDGYSHDFSYLFSPRSMLRKRAQKNVYGINFNFTYIFQTGNMFFPSAYELILFHTRASISFILYYAIVEKMAKV